MDAFPCHPSGRLFFEDKLAVVTVGHMEIDGLPSRRSDSGKTYTIPLRQIESGEGPGFRKATVSGHKPDLHCRFRPIWLIKNQLNHTGPIIETPSRIFFYHDLQGELP